MAQDLENKRKNLYGQSLLKLSLVKTLKTDLTNSHECLTNCYSNELLRDHILQQSYVINYILLQYTHSRTTVIGLHQRNI